VSAVRFRPSPFQSKMSITEPFGAFAWAAPRLIAGHTGGGQFARRVRIWFVRRD
jgi:hypothetical protein